MQMLSLNKKTGYGLIAMTHLARLNDGQVASAREIAEKFGVPMSLLMNVLKELSAANFVESVRGAHGGYRLARDPEGISLADLVEVLEGPIRLAACVTGELEPGEKAVCRMMESCPIADPVHRVQRRLHDFLCQVSLAELAEPALPNVRP